MELIHRVLSNVKGETELLRFVDKGAQEIIAQRDVCTDT